MLKYFSTELSENTAKRETKEKNIPKKYASLSRILLQFSNILFWNSSEIFILIKRFINFILIENSLFPKHTHIFHESYYDLSIILTLSRKKFREKCSQETINRKRTVLSTNKSFAIKIDRIINVVFFARNEVTRILLYIFQEFPERILKAETPFKTCVPIPHGHSPKFHYDSLEHWAANLRKCSSIARISLRRVAVQAVTRHLIHVVCHVTLSWV